MAWQAWRDWALAVPAVVLLAVVAASVLYDVAWLTSRCVDWDTTWLDDQRTDTHPGCQGYEITTVSRAQAVAFTVGAAAFMLLAGGAAFVGLVQRRAALFWGGSALLVVASIPWLYQFPFWGDPHPFQTVTQAMREPWHAGIAAVAAFFFAARASDALAPTPAFSPLPMRVAAVLLLVGQGLWTFMVASINGDLDFGGRFPLLFWVLFLTPPVMAVIAFWRFPPADAPPPRLAQPHQAGAGQQPRDEV